MANWAWAKATQRRATVAMPLVVLARTRPQEGGPLIGGEVETMPFVAAIALTVFYVGLTLAWGGIHPGSGVPWWLFAPFIVTLCAALLAAAISAVLPAPWTAGRRYGAPSRRVHLSWRTAVRMPVLAPMLVLLYHVYGSLSLHFEIGWVAYLGAALAGMAVAFVARRCRREFRLLRDGEMAVGVVDARSNLGEAPERIAYHFTTTRGTTISARGCDVGYGVVEDASVPVFYDAVDPGNHVVACGCWFEAQ